MQKKALLLMATLGLGLLFSACGRTDPAAAPASTLSTGPAVPAPEPTVLAQVVTTQPPQDVTYVVQPGDSLSLIAERFGVSTQALADFNAISDPNSIKQGQSLVIPPADSTTTTTADG